MSIEWECSSERIVIIDSAGIDRIMMFTCWVAVDEETGAKQIQFPKTFELDLEGGKKEYIIHRYSDKQAVMMYKERTK